MDIEFHNVQNTFYWGPIYWNVLHNIAKKIDEFSYNIKFFMYIKNIFIYLILFNLKNILPCDTCKNNYYVSLQCALKNWYDMKPQEYYYIQSLVFVLHNCVNLKRNTKKFLFFDTIKNLKPIEINKFIEINQQLKFTDEISYKALVGLFHILYPFSHQEMKKLCI